MNNVSLHDIPNRKKFIKRSFRLLLPLISASRFRPYQTPAAVSQQIWTPLCTVLLYNLGNILMEHFAMFIKDGSHVFGKKNLNGNAKK
jgi:hypothetical protein